MDESPCGPAENTQSGLVNAPGLVYGNALADSIADHAAASAQLPLVLVASALKLLITIMGSIAKSFRSRDKKAKAKKPRLRDFSDLMHGAAMGHELLELDDESYRCCP